MKKKYFYIALLYALFAMVGGVFYREFTKWNSFKEPTALGKVHTHLFVLGMLLFIIIGILSDRVELEKFKDFRIFIKIYNIGLPILAISMAIRGVLQVEKVLLSNVADFILSSIAGLGHIMVGAGIIFFMLTLIKSAEN